MIRLFRVYRPDPLYEKKKGMGDIYISPRSFYKPSAVKVSRTMIGTEAVGLFCDEDIEAVIGCLRSVDWMGYALRSTNGRYNIAKPHVAAALRTAGYEVLE